MMRLGHIFGVKCSHCVSALHPHYWMSDLKEEDIIAAAELALEISPRSINYAKSIVNDLCGIIDEDDCLHALVIAKTRVINYTLGPMAKP